MTLRRFTSFDYPYGAGIAPVAGWLDQSNSTELQRKIIVRAFADIGILEVPLGSNRGKRIDEYTRRAGSPLASWWCAIWAGAVFRDVGALVPEGYPSCDKWLPYLQREPVLGSAILYGVRGNAHHIGIVARLSPLVLTIEGNRGYAGTTNNGVAVDIGPLQRKDILGYFVPRLQ